MYIKVEKNSRLKFAYVKFEKEKWIIIIFSLLSLCNGHDLPNTFMIEMTRKNITDWFYIYREITVNLKSTMEGGYRSRTQNPQD